MTIRSIISSMDNPSASHSSSLQIVGDFELLRRIGEGSMGTVYKARQLSRERIVALKLLTPEMISQPRLLQRFYREARLMIRLSHPNIVTGYEVGQTGNQHYFAMEYVSGVSVQEVRRLLSPMSVSDALYIAVACAHGLHFAHELGLVHRDVKATNVLVRRDGVVKLTDLGMMKVLDDDVGMTKTGYAIGTPSYMPLEQARDGKSVDRRSDIYALGCLLYSLLTAQMPFQGKDRIELILSKQAGVFVPASQLNPAVSQHLDQILARMMARLPEDRYPSCAELIADLAELKIPTEQLSFIPTRRDLWAAAQARKARSPMPARVDIERRPDGPMPDEPVFARRERHKSSGVWRWGFVAVLCLVVAVLLYGLTSRLLAG